MLWKRTRFALRVDSRSPPARLQAPQPCRVGVLWFYGQAQLQLNLLGVIGAIADRAPVIRSLPSLKLSVTDKQPLS